MNVCEMGPWALHKTDTENLSRTERASPSGIEVIGHTVESADMNVPRERVKLRNL